MDLDLPHKLRYNYLNLPIQKQGISTPQSEIKMKASRIADKVIDFIYRDNIQLLSPHISRDVVHQLLGITLEDNLGCAGYCCSGIAVGIYFSQRMRMSYSY